MKIALSTALIICSSFLNFVFADEPSPASVNMLIQQNLPPLDDNQEVLVLTVTYEPGGSSKIHRHNANAFVYMLEGSVVMQVQGGEEVTLKPGDTFYENRADIHAVSRNASDTKPARFLVFIIKERGVPATVPAHAEP
jgi:quercetin dioxygenase-like cupin family protein